jgi:ABC-type uncharacterized transport system permease subunit
MDLSSWASAALVSLPMGLIYGIGTIGFSLGYHYLRFPDFTTVASITIGGIAFVAFTNLSGQWLVGLLGSIIIGALLGLCTGIQIKNFRIPPILAGITTFVGAKSVMFWMNDNKADALFIKSPPEIIGGPVSSFTNTLLAFFEVFLIAYIISRLFTFVFGDYVLALHGAENYLQHRHPFRNLTVIILLIISNSIISLAGGVSAIQMGQASVDAHADFLLLALAGYSFGSLVVFSVNRLPKHESQKRVETSAWVAWFFLLPKIYNWYSEKAHKNEEEPDRIFITFITYALATMIVNAIFKVIDVEAPSAQNSGFILKAGVLFVCLWWASTIQLNDTSNQGE